MKTCGCISNRYDESWDKIFITENFTIDTITKEKNYYKVSVKFALFGRMENDHFILLKRKNRPQQFFSSTLNIISSENKFTIQSPNYPPMISQKTAIDIFERNIISNNKHLSGKQTK